MSLIPVSEPSASAFAISFARLALSHLTGVGEASLSVPPVSRQSAFDKLGAGVSLLRVLGARHSGRIRQCSFPASHGFLSCSGNTPFRTPLLPAGCYFI